MEFHSSQRNLEVARLGRDFRHRIWTTGVCRIQIDKVNAPTSRSESIVHRGKSNGNFEVELIAFRLSQRAKEFIKMRRYRFTKRQEPDVWFASRAVLSI